jgi:DNA-binding MarR family transcriptional regulator
MELPTTQRDAAEVPPLPCLCASLRRAARAISQLYDRELRATGLRSTQHTLLQVLAGNEGIAQKQLGELLALDTSTLSRTLRPLEKRGWIRSLPGEDLRQRRFALTPRGRRQLERARPHWDRAQERVRTQLGPAEWDEVMAALLRVTGAVE